MSAHAPRHRRPAPPPAGSAVAGLVLGVAALVALALGAAVEAAPSPGLDPACGSRDVDVATFCSR